MNTSDKKYKLICYTFEAQIKLYDQRDNIEKYANNIIEPVKLSDRNKYIVYEILNYFDNRYLSPEYDINNFERLYDVKNWKLLYEYEQYGTIKEFSLFKSLVNKGLMESIVSWFPEDLARGEYEDYLLAEGSIDPIAYISSDLCYCLPTYNNDEELINRYEKEIKYNVLYGDYGRGCSPFVKKMRIGEIENEEETFIKIAESL